MILIAWVSGWVGLSFHFHTFTFTLLLSHFHFYTFTPSLSHFHTFTLSLFILSQFSHSQIQNEINRKGIVGDWKTFKHSLSHFHSHFQTFTNSLSHIHFHTFTFAHSLSHIHFHLSYFHKFKIKWTGKGSWETGKLISLLMRVENGTGSKLKIRKLNIQKLKIQKVENTESWKYKIRDKR